jgi:hypothetical protein
VWQTSLNRQIRQTSRGVLALSITVRREWVDDAVGPRAHVSAIWTGNASALSLKESEFFNRSIDRVYSLSTAPPLNISLATLPSTVDTHGSLADGSGRSLPGGLFLTDSSAPLGGKLLASDPGTGLRLYRSARAPRLDSFLQGRFADGWTGPELTFTLYRCHPARVLLVFGRYPGLVPGPQTVVARVNERIVSRVVLAPSRKSGAVAASVRPDADGRCEVDYDISPTASPVSVLGVPDTRALGVHVDLLRVSPHSPT